MLRGFELRDRDYFQSFFSDEVASRHVGGPSGREDTWRRMLAGVGLWPLTGIGLWAIASRDSGTAIGHAGFFDFLRECEPSIVGEPEMGWILAPEVHGRGYAQEACQAVLAWFDEQFGRRTIVALISPGNEASMKLAEKLGFKREPDGTYREKPQTVWRRPA